MQFPFQKDFLRLLAAPLDMCLHISRAERLIAAPATLFSGRFRASCQPLIKVYVPDLETISHEKLITARVSERERWLQRSKSDFTAKLSALLLFSFALEKAERRNICSERGKELSTTRNRSARFEKCNTRTINGLIIISPQTNLSMFMVSRS